jgi:hypothetical protein
LILAHHQPAHLKRMIRSLAYKKDAFFVHLDLKADISHFAISDVENVFFLSKRIKVSHAGFSQVKAMIALMKTALKTQDFEYFIFLSGVDYPLKSPQKIHDFLDKNKGTNFISFYNYDGAHVDNYHLSSYFSQDLVHGSSKVVSWIVRVFLKCIRLCLPKRTLPGPMIPYRGSTSWALHRESIEYILNFLKTPYGKKLLKFFRYGFSPDEMIFQTVLLNSPLAKNCNFYQRDIEPGKRILKLENRAYLHYIDWSEDREGPAILSEDDFERLINSERFFARKFDEKRSAKLLDMIDKQLL